MKVPGRTEFLEGRLSYYHRIGNDNNLSLRAKGLMLAIGDIPPFLGGMEEIKKRCNSDESEIYAGLSELADKGYLYFSDIALYLGHHSKCDDCKERR